MRLTAILGLFVTLALAQSAPTPRLRTWSRETLRTAHTLRGDVPMAVGSLQKPFVAKAWAAAHPGQQPPRLVCGPDSHCWHPKGHGELGLSRALAVSCNAYFRRLATETPLKGLQASLAQAGFQGQLSGPDAALGLPGASPLVIRPSRLLEAYAHLVREPWSEGEEVRQQVLAGLRDAARSGTAAGLAQGGCWAKTGTLPATDGDPTKTRGFVLVLDDTGRGTLAELEPGTGREAAVALGRQLRWGYRSEEGPPGRVAPSASPLVLPHAMPGQSAVIAPDMNEGDRPVGSRPSQEIERPVVVRLFDLLAARKWKVRNLGPGAIPARQGFLGPGASLELSGEDWVGPGLLEIEVPGTGLIRRLEGRLAVVRDRNGGRYLAAALAPREYVSGVLAAELPGADEARRLTLGAAALRFLAKGPRHEEADVCDSTHCAWFVGRGPQMRWITPRRAIQPAAHGETPGAISDREWSAMIALAERPGPSLWSSDCGGKPLSSHTLWGDSNHEVFSCPRHTAANTQPWHRIWKAADLARAFGRPVEGLEIRFPEGVWTLSVQGPTGTKDYRFDEAHRRLARILGWDALPSPADEIQPSPEGFRVRGVGQGHRVGLCLGD